MSYEFSIISLIPTSFILGASFYPADENEYKYNEINIYLLIIQLQYRWL